MPSTAAATMTSIDSTRVLPREAMWFFVVAPPVLATIFDPDCLKAPSPVARALIAITGYTVLTGLAVHFSFDALARHIARISMPARVVLHAVGAALVVLAVTVPQLPLIALVYPETAGDAATIAWRGVLVSYVYLAIASFIGHLQRQAVRERFHAHEQTRAALEARLAAFQAQMQPHFLFNSLNVCAGLVRESPEAAESTLERLAGFLRFALESTERRWVTLDEELDAIAAYFEVQRQRFGDRLRYEIDASKEAGARDFPPMLIQPLVENALLHGLKDRERGGLVCVAARIEDGVLVIRVEDDGVGPGASAHRGTGTGQRNVRERIRLVYGDKATFETRRSMLGGYACELHLPQVGRR